MSVFIFTFGRKKMQKNLHISKKSSTFASDLIKIQIHKCLIKILTIMANNYHLCRRSSNGRNVVLFESSDLHEILLHFVHSVEFERFCGYQIHRVFLNGLDSYFLYGNSLFTAKVFIL